MEVQRLRDYGGYHLMEVFHLKFVVLHMLNSWLSHGTKHSLYVYLTHHLVEIIVIPCK